MRADPTAKNQQPNPSPERLVLIFALLALISTIGLDYAAARRGEKAYFFVSRAARKEAAVAPVPLADSVRRFLGTSGIPPESVEELEDTDGTPRIVVYLPLKDYESLERRLDKELRDKRASVEKEKKDEEGLTSYTWRIAGPPEDSLSLVFSLLEPAAEKKEEEKEVKEEEKEVKVAPPSPPENRVAIIIDDMGDSLEALQEVCDLGQPVTISILPFSPFAEETARTAHGNGLEGMLPLPGASRKH